ncbi:MAG: diadenylate cyclase CdaA [Faecalibacterium sp.]|nr:diadenylate cyclase CdaA [Ruminococcus sp.]MCM1391624.1 diadenylate cyclase CdaA [Ruminococcus sp.]MCM1486693.1 diadenylate cyclase CdaA [Faecalibacterium sp.]
MTEFIQTLGENAVKLISSVRWNDILDIVTVTLVLYYCIKTLRQTRAIHLVKGLSFLGIIFVIVSALNMSTSSYLFSKLFNDLVIVLVILFQSEIRHAIETFGRGDFKKFSFFSSKNNGITEEQMRRTSSFIAKAAGEMSDDKIGALIVLEGKSPLGEIISTGSVVDAQISIPLLENIFYPKSPLHDGAMIIRQNRIHAAGCILPLTQNQISRELGTRHRAALGMSEHSDAMIVVVSEETGAISVAENGTLTRDITQGELLEKLTEFLINDSADGIISLKKGRRKNSNEE